MLQRKHSTSYYFIFFRLMQKRKTLNIEVDEFTEKKT